MKILLLLSGLLFSGGLFADMDYICSSDANDAYKLITEKCERNNILTVRDIPSSLLDYWIAAWCRYDREINYVKGRNADSMNLSCVLYSNEPREDVE